MDYGRVESLIASLSCYRGYCILKSIMQKGHTYKLRVTLIPLSLIHTYVLFSLKKTFLVFLSNTIMLSLSTFVPAKEIAWLTEIFSSTLKRRICIFKSNCSTKRNPCLSYPLNAYLIGSESIICVRQV